MLTAVVFLVLLEVTLRVLNRGGLLPADVNGELSFRGVPPELALYGAPELAVLGSSRAQRGVLAPVLRSLLAKSGIDGRVGNFALGGTRAEETELVVRRLLEVEKPPRLLIWPITAREFETRNKRPAPTVRYLWRPDDWWRARMTDGHQADRYLPDALRNELARHSWLVRYRFAVQDLIQEPPREGMLAGLAAVVSPHGRRVTPMHGNVHPWHLGRGRYRSLSLKVDKVEHYVGDAYQEPEWPKNYQAAHLESAVARAQAAGVDVLFVEIPSHPMLEAALPPRTTDKFRSYLRELSGRRHLLFVDAEALALELELGDFYEQSHLNYRGADKYTRALAPLIRRRLAATPAPTADAQ